MSGTAAGAGTWSGALTCLAGWSVPTRPQSTLSPWRPRPCAGQTAAPPAPGLELCGSLPLQVMGSILRFRDCTVNNPAVLNKGAAWSVTALLNVVIRHER